MSDSHSIITLLDQQKQHLDALFLLLRQELAALANRDIEALENITVEKTQLLTLIQHTDKTLADISDLQTYTQQDWFTEKVSVLEELLAQCKRQNDVNEQTLEQSQLTLERLKTTLLSARGKAGLTYTNKGKPSIENKGKGIKA